MNDQGQAILTEGPDRHVINKRFGDKTFIIKEWNIRYSGHAAIRAQIDKYCDGMDHELFYRGVNHISFIEDLFVLGLKARPQLSASDPKKLRHHARALASTRLEFERLARAFVNSDMVKWMMKRTVNKSCTFDGLTQIWQTGNDSARVRLAQLLLYGLQYQNTRGLAKEWRDYLFVLSATTDEDIAIGYACMSSKETGYPKVAFVIEYAPPCAGHYFEPIDAVICEFSELELGTFYENKESEVMIPFAMLPHYVLGYIRLDLDAESASDVTYISTYVANPAFEQGYTLERPKDLTEEQEKKRRELNDKIAWAYVRWTLYGGEWFKLCHGDKTHDISGTSATSRREQW